MVNSLYFVSSIVFAFIIGILIINEYDEDKKKDNVEKAYYKLLVWVLFFCMQDALWGLSGSDFLLNDNLLFITSSIFHISTVVTTYFWLNYVINYLSDNFKHKKLLLGIDKLIILFQVILVITNFFTPTIFYIENGIYNPAGFRIFAFLNQYLVYLLIGITSLVAIYKANDKYKDKFFSVLMFTLIPILLGIFQYLYPDGPFYSMGYFLGCFVIHIFIVSKERMELSTLKYEKDMARQIKISNTDKLTGLSNRHAYENKIKKYTKRLPNNFVYASIDVNGLKGVNDNLGHLAGDEVIKGAGNCIRKCLSSYGEVYRIGGDEFSAIIFAKEDEIEKLKEDIEETTSKWHGELVKELHVSCGFASKNEFDNISLVDLIKIADDRMYEVKEKYYNDRGIDRLGQKEAYNTLCETYQKILKVNLTLDTYKIIYMSIDEKMDSDKISEWLYNFGVSGLVHKDDVLNYLKTMDFSSLKRKFKSGKNEVSINYRRKYGNKYRLTRMDLIKSSSYTDDNQVVYLYVKDIDK